MITIPVWLFAVLLGIAGSSALALLWVWNRADERVDRILDEELYHPLVSDHFCGAGGSTEGAEQVPGVRVRVNDQEASDRAERGQSDG